MLNNLSNANYSHLTKFGTTRKFQSGQVIQFQNEAVEYIFIVQDGIAFALFYEVNGKENWVDSFEQGDIIGIEHIQTGGPALCQITARTNVCVLQFKRKTFAELMVEFQDLNKLVIEHLISSLRRSQNVHLESQMLTTRGRVASEIRRMVKPSDGSKGYIVSPKPVLSDIALRLGMARETVSRSVSDLIKFQVINKNQHAFFVPDISLLEAQMH